MNSKRITILFTLCLWRLFPSNTGAGTGAAEDERRTRPFDRRLQRCKRPQRLYPSRRHQPKIAHQNYGWKASDEPHPDLALLEKLHNLSSFDVYSLRILFRKLGIQSPKPDALQLSAQTKASLSAHLKRFTAPLILNVYGNVSALDNAADLVEIFRNPGKESAVQNLRALADRQEVGIEGIPEFLERFSECYLSISYFERYLHVIYPDTLGRADACSCQRRTLPHPSGIGIRREMAKSMAQSAVISANENASPARYS